MAAAGGRRKTTKKSKKQQQKSGMIKDKMQVSFVTFVSFVPSW